MRKKKGMPGYWTLLSVLALALAVFAAVSFAQEVRRRAALKEHVESLRREIAEREQKVEGLEQLTNFLKTSNYLERSAREKLNVRKPGETVVMVPSAPEVNSASDVRRPVRTNRPIPLQWWDLYFSP